MTRKTLVRYKPKSVVRRPNGTVYTTRPIDQQLANYADYVTANPISATINAAKYAAKKAYNYATDDRANRARGMQYTVGSRPMNATGSKPALSSSKVPKKVGYTTPTTGKNVTLKNSKKRCPPVSKAFREKVACAQKAKALVSTYTASYHGQLLAPTNAAASSNFQSYAGYLTDGTAVALAAATGENNFTFFTPLRVLDQASLLFNSKSTTNSQNWTLTTGNFDVKGLEIHVVYQYVKIVLRNNTGQSKEIDFYECTPKLNTEVAPTTIFDACIADDVSQGILITQGTISGNMYGFTPGHTRNFKNTYKYSKRSMSLAPGASTSFTISGPKDFTYLYDKFHDPDVPGTITPFPKNIGIQCMYIVKNIELTNTLNGVTVQSATGHNQGSATSASQTGVLCEITHHSAIEAPEVTSDANKRELRYYDHHNNWATALSEPFSAMRIIPETDILSVSNSLPM